MGVHPQQKNSIPKKKEPQFQKGAFLEIEKEALLRKDTELPQVVQTVQKRALVGNIKL